MRAAPSLLGRSHGGAVSRLYLEPEHPVWTDTEGLFLVHSGLDRVPLREGRLAGSSPWPCPGRAGCPYPVQPLVPKQAVVPQMWLGWRGQQG